VRLDKQNKYYQYGRVPFRVHLSYNESQTSLINENFPPLFIIDDMDYKLPPPAASATPQLLILALIFLVLAA